MQIYLQGSAGRVTGVTNGNVTLFRRFYWEICDFLKSVAGVTFLIVTAEHLVTSAKAGGRRGPNLNFVIGGWEKL